MKQKINTLLAIFTVSLAVAGCNTTLTKSLYVVQIDSISSSKSLDRVSEKIAYRLIPGNEGLSPSDIQYLEYAEYVKKALNEHSYYEGYLPDLVVGFSYGISGPIQRVSGQGRLYDVYERYIILAGFVPLNAENEDEIRTVWKTTIKSSGSSGDLRSVFPVMLGAALPYITKNTRGQVVVEINEDSKAVKLIQGDD